MNENTITTTEPKKDNRSFKWYLKSKISGNDLDWVDKEIDWNDAYRDPEDAYIWYFPLKYTYNAERVAEAVRRNLNRGNLQTKVMLVHPEDKEDPVVKIIFKNSKKERETGINNLEESINCLCNTLDSIFKDECVQNSINKEGKIMENYNKLHEKLDELLTPINEAVAVMDTTEEGLQLKTIVLPGTVSAKAINDKYPDILFVGQERNRQSAENYILSYGKPGQLYAIKFGYDDKWLIGGYFNINESLI